MAHNKTCSNNGNTFANDKSELLGRLVTNVSDGPCRPIENAKLAVIIKSTYKNWKFPKIDEFYLVGL